MDEEHIELYTGNTMQALSYFAAAELYNALGKTTLGKMIPDGELQLFAHAFQDQLQRRPFLDEPLAQPPPVDPSELSSVIHLPAKMPPIQREL